jgi:hypothetical protein
MTMTDTRARTMPPIQTAHLFDLVADVDDRIDFGDGPLGRRILDRVRSGTFAGERLRGTVLPGSGDWLLFRPDGGMTIDARVTLLTDDGSHISMTYGGRVVVPDDVRPAIRDLDHRHTIDPGRYYMRSTPVFETGAPRYRWLNDVVAIGSGYLVEGGGVGYRVWAVL